MGENSKTSGEIGESIASALLEKVGWGSLLNNVSISCHNKNHINDSGKQKSTHGEDHIFLYNSPFHDDRTEVVHVSDKNNIKKYPGSQTLKKKFKDHILELNQTMECAKNSPEVNELYVPFQAKKNIYHSGLLMWFQNDTDEIEKDIKPDLANIQLDINSSTPFYLIDNERASFLLKVISHLDVDASNYYFYYPRTGTATSVETMPAGSFLPLELMCSNIIPVIVELSGGEREFRLYANEVFEENSYRKLIAYALSFSAGLIASVKVGTKTYNAAHDRQTAHRVRMSFSDRKETIEPFSFHGSILNLI